MKVGDCLHFNGIQHDTCRAGVRYLDVRDASQPGPYRWPCITFRGECAATTCAAKKPATQADVDAHKAETKRAIDAFVAGRCPTHDVALDKRDMGAAVIWRCPTEGCDFSARGCKRVGPEEK